MEYEIELEPGRVVVLRELTTGEFESVFRAVASDPNQGWELTQRGLRMSLVRDGETELEYKALAGGQLTQRYTVRQMLLLRQAWEAIHLPTAEEQSRVRAMRAVTG